MATDSKTDRKYTSQDCHQAITGEIDMGRAVGMCRCGAELCLCIAPDPRTGQLTQCLAHAMPFCAYYRDTEPETILRELELELQAN